MTGGVIRELTIFAACAAASILLLLWGSRLRRRTP